MSKSNSNSNTGEKGIHWREERGVFQVYVSWRGLLLHGTTDDLAEAVAMRNAFEKRLGKPRTDRRILPYGLGYCVTTSGRKEERRKVVQAHIAPAPGKRRTTTFVLSGNEEADALQYSNAAAWRRKMEKRYYYVQDQRH